MSIKGNREWGIGHRTWDIEYGEQNTFLYFLIYLLNYILNFQKYLMSQIYRNKIVRHYLIVYENKKPSFLKY